MSNDNHVGEAFEVVTVRDEHRFSIACETRIVQNENAPSFLIVEGDDDWQDGGQELRTFNLAHVVDFGWSV